MMEQLYLARERDGLVHVGRTQHWKFMLDEGERSFEDELGVEEALCGDHNFYEEVYDVLITCVACVACLVEIERELGVQWWKERSA